MNKSEIKQLAHQLQAINYDRLPISSYNKTYIARIHGAIPYYLEIFARLIREGIDSAGLPLEEITLVDYGGGSGFLSILAKRMGIGKVIYIDLNPKSVEAAGILKKEAEAGPDIILEGNSDRLADWCREQSIRPHLLIATDLIEHVYDLKPFFADLTSINPSLIMTFTTASTPYNPIIKRRLHKFMAGNETGTLETPNYYTIRKDFIAKQYPNMSSKEQEQWTKQTRGLIYDDIRRAIENGEIPTPPDHHNTCDPRTGNWAERILPIRTYREILHPLGFTVKVRKGFYNTHRSNPARLICQALNTAIRLTGKAGLIAAPFIALRVRPKKR